MDVSPTTNGGQQLHLDSPLSITEILTPDVCSRLLDPNDYRVLVSRPTVQVIKVDEHPPIHVEGFIAQYRVVIIDADRREVEAVIPVDAVFHGSFNSLGGCLQAGSVLRINQMLRLANGREQYVSPQLNV